MEPNQSRPRYRVPDELREVLLDFTIAYLLERPNNIVDFGAQFFQRLQGSRGGGGGAAPAITGRSMEPGSAPNLNASNANVSQLPVDFPEEDPGGSMYLTF